MWVCGVCVCVYKSTCYNCIFIFFSCCWFHLRLVFIVVPVFTFRILSCVWHWPRLFVQIIYLCMQLWILSLSHFDHLKWSTWLNSIYSGWSDMACDIICTYASIKYCQFCKSRKIFRVNKKNVVFTVSREIIESVYKRIYIYTYPHVFFVAYMA